MKPSISIRPVAAGRNIFCTVLYFAMGSVASDLKSAREKQSISLAQIAADTKISLHYLVSLEEGRYSELPGACIIAHFCGHTAKDLTSISRKF